MAINNKGVSDSKQNNLKIWKATPDSDAGVMVSSDTAFLIGNKYNFITASNTGLSFNGNSLSFNCLSEQIRKGGIFIEMNDFLRMIPPTIVTPIPPQMPFPPIALPLAIIGGTAFFVAMLAGS